MSTTLEYDMQVRKIMLGMGVRKDYPFLPQLPFNREVATDSGGFVHVKHTPTADTNLKPIRTKLVETAKTPIHEVYGAKVPCKPQKQGFKGGRPKRKT